MNTTANANLFSRLFDTLDDPNRLAIETADGGQWSVDSWTHAYGEAPDILTIAEWKNRK